ncbi:metallophosphoesterase [Chromobacterium haemolyticum]|nr:metallophosphoesterase [Chromobacterium haemolyticum]
MRAAQISDTHLFAEAGGQLMGYDTYREFDRVLEQLERRHAAELDAILVTGDISQDESAASYERFAQRLERTGLPVYWLAGNHDAAPLAAERCWAATTSCGRWSVWKRRTGCCWRWIRSGQGRMTAI